MKKFVFTLEKVMSFKKQTLDVKKGEMAQLQGRLRETEKQIEELRRRYIETNEDLAVKMTEGMLPADISLTKLFLNKLEMQRQAQVRAKKQLQDLISLKKKDILAIRTDISGLERLREKQWDDYRKAEQKEQELSIEEFVSHARAQ